MHGHDHFDLTSRTAFGRDGAVDRSAGLNRHTVAVIDLSGTDLPCPWCGEATVESDDHCRGCGQRFG